MATDFFEQQDKAHRKTTLLVAYFLLAVVSLIVLAYLLFAFVFLYLPERDAQQSVGLVDLWSPPILVGVTIGALILVGGATLFKIAELASGGKAVALMLGGDEVPGTTKSPAQRRLLNVVEEMSIASGVPMPAVYVLPDEKCINAFAAGYSTGDAVVAVSQGSLDFLTRDELQGVVAHEFSHILNGDMRLNIRLIGIIAGITTLSLIGWVLLRSTSSGRSSRSSKDGDGRGGLFILGLGLYVLGLAGAFFGSLIKAAVSRQREFLADASAVQFTRNPDGIGGALKKIGGLQAGSRIESSRAAEISHAWVSDAFIGMRMSDALATHPPLDERIRRIDPHFDGTYPNVKPVDPGDEKVKGPQPGKLPPMIPGIPQLPLPVTAAALEAVAARVGHVSQEEVSYAHDLLEEIPDELREAVREPFSARALDYALLLSPEHDVRRVQFAQLESEADPRDYREARRLAERVRHLPAVARLPLLELTIPALRQMSSAQHRSFREQVDQLIQADNKVSIFEFALHCVLSRQLDEAFEGQRSTSPSRKSKWSPLRLRQEMANVLSLLAWEGHKKTADAEKAFAVGMRVFLDGDEHHYRLIQGDKCSLPTFHSALKVLAEATPRLKRRVIMGCTACIFADRQVTVEEGELLRAIGAVLGAPLPPLVGRSE